MLRTFRIGRLLGFPIEVNLSFLILLAIFSLWLGPAAGILFLVMAFGSVLLHELGHALVARHLGVEVGGIELHFFGGAAKLMGQPKSAGDEIAIAAAGPAVSFALAGVGLGLASVTGSPLVSMFGWINLIMALFNLVPALPLDGGRIFRALLSKRMGFLPATETSVKVARVFAVAMGAFAVATLQIYLGLLAIVLWSMGSAELSMARQLAEVRRGSWNQVEVLPRGFRASDSIPRARVSTGWAGPRRGAR